MQIAVDANVSMCVYLIMVVNLLKITVNCVCDELHIASEKAGNETLLNRFIK